MENEENRKGNSSNSSIPIYKYNKNPSNLKKFWELSKKQFLVRFRTPASLIEIFFSFVFFFIIVPIDKLSSQVIPGDPNPIPVYNADPIALDIALFFLESNSTSVIAGPKTSAVFSLMNYLYSSFLQYTPLKVQYADNESSIPKQIDKVDSNGFGIYWENSEKEDFLTHPVIHTFTKCTTNCPTYSLYQYIRNYISLELMKLNPKNDEISKLAFLNSSFQKFASLPYQKHKIESQIPLIFIGSVIILSTMPDFEILSQEKFTKLSSLYFLMGCSRTIYYLSVYFVSFICTIFTSFVMSLFYCYYYLYKNVCFSLFFMSNVLFSLCFISFSLFVSTFFRSSKIAGFYSPFMFILNIVLVIMVTADFDRFWTSDFGSNKFLGLIPHTCFLFIACSLRMDSIQENIYINWSNLSQPELQYDISYGLLFLTFNAVLYTILFVISYIISIHWSEIKNKISSIFHHGKNQNIFQNNDDNEMPLFDVNDNNNNFFVRIKNLSKCYSKIDINNINQNDLALKCVSFDVKKNEIIVVTGPNGAGKTTLINILSGVIQPSLGTLELNQANIEFESENENLTFSSNPNKELKPTSLEEENNKSLSTFLLNQKHHIPSDPIASSCLKTANFSMLQPYLGVVFQENVFVSYLSVRENLILFGTLRGISKEDIETFTYFFADALQMRDSLSKLAKDLSGGQKRKLCLAIALIGNPSILLLDEPTSGVDVQGRQLIWKLISSLTTTSIVTTHGLEEAEAASTRIFLINNGKIPFTGNSAELREKFQCGYMIKFDNGPSAAQSALEIIRNDVLLNKKLNPEMARIRNDFLDTIYIPICPEVTDCLNEIEKRKDEFNIGEYSIFIEQLEDLILSTENII